MLRGRGGCYKHTFYGIESHRCMETTPSLACANKCVFCWRLINHNLMLFFFFIFCYFYLIKTSYKSSWYVMAMEN